MAEKKCIVCGCGLASDDKAIYRKMICRSATEYMCTGCLADKLRVPRKQIDDLIAYYHRSGVCRLFAKYENI